MAFAILARNVTIGVTPYGARTGTPTAGTLVPLCTLARRVSSEYQVDEIEQTALCDTEKVFQAGTYSETFQIEAMVPSTGYIFQPLLPQWVRVTFDLDGIGALGAITIDGWISSHSVTAEVNGTVIETVTIRKRGVAFA